MDYQIEAMKDTDWEDVSLIYWEGILTKKATFQSILPSWEEWDSSHLSQCRLVARQGESILGWAALSPVSSRCVYAGVAEVSIYVREGCRGGQVGTRLLEALIRESEKNGLWTLQSGIIKENVSSILLHKKCGFREIGYRERVGKMDTGKWHDVVLVERRSSVVGIED